MRQPRRRFVSAGHAGAHCSPSLRRPTAKPSIAVFGDRNISPGVKQSTPLARFPVMTDKVWRTDLVPSTWWGQECLLSEGRHWQQQRRAPPCPCPHLAPHSSVRACMLCCDVRLLRFQFMYVIVLAVDTLALLSGCCWLSHLFLIVTAQCHGSYRLTDGMDAVHCPPAG